MAGVRHNQRAADPTAPTPLGGRPSSLLPVVVLTGSVLAALWALAMLTAPGRVGVAYVFYFLQFYAGVFTLVSLTITVLAGLLATDRLVLMVRHRVLLQSVHRTLGTMAVVLLVAHVLSKVMYGAVPVIGVLVPFTGGNRPVFVGFGILAGYLMVAVFWTGIARARFIGVGKPWMWRIMHATVYLSWPLALLHGLSAGRPPATWVVASYLACALVVTVLLVIRISTYLQRRRRGQLGTTTGSMKPVGKVAGASPTGTGSGFRYVAQSDIRAAYAPREPRQPVRQQTAYEQRVASYEQLGGRPPREYQTEEEYAAMAAASRDRRTGPARDVPGEAYGPAYQEPGYGPAYQEPAYGPADEEPAYQEPGYGQLAPRPVSAPVTRPVSGPAARPVSAPVTRPVSAPVTRPVSAPVTRPVSGGARRAAPEPPRNRDDHYAERGYAERGYAEQGYAERRDAGRRADGRRTRRDDIDDGYGYGYGDGDGDGYRPARYRDDRTDHRAETRAEFPASAPPRRRFEDGYAGADQSVTTYAAGGYSATDYVRAADPMPPSPPPTGTPWRETTSEFGAVDESGPRARTRSGRHSSREDEAGYSASSPVSSAYPPPSYQHDEPPAEEPRYEEPRYEEPRYEEPRYEAAARSEEPRYTGPGYGQEARYEQWIRYEEQRHDDLAEPDDTPTLVDMAKRRALRESRGEPVPSAPRAPRRRNGARPAGSMRNLADVSDEEYWAQLRGEAR